MVRVLCNIQTKVHIMVSGKKIKSMDKASISGQMVADMKVYGGIT